MELCHQLGLKESVSVILWIHDWVFIWVHYNKCDQQLYITNTQSASLIGQVLMIHGDVHGMKHSIKDSKAEI